MKLEGVDQVIANPDTSEVIIHGSDPDIDKIISTVEDIGYEFKGSK